MSALQAVSLGLALVSIALSLSSLFYARRAQRLLATARLVAEQYAMPVIAISHHDARVRSIVREEIAAQPAAQQADAA